MPGYYVATVYPALVRPGDYFANQRVDRVQHHNDRVMLSLAGRGEDYPPRVALRDPRDRLTVFRRV
jgi:hypothetical protein